MFGMLARSAADNKVGFSDWAVLINKYSSTYSTKYTTKYIIKYITKFRAVKFHTFFHINLHTKCKVNYLYSITTK